MASEQARVQAEIQSALTIAAARPRNEVSAIDAIATSCQRPGLAEKAEYVYSRGGTEITGPTIDLLTVISNQWGNVSYGFRELSENPQESVVEAYAWDLQTNSKRSVTFTVKHARHTRSGTYPLTDPRDRYENLANLAQRRVRACLEAIIPPDVVEDAVAQCRETMKASADVTPDAIKKLTAAYTALGITKEQIEKRLGRRIDTMQPAQLVSLRRIYKSIQDGMSKPADWFESTVAEEPQKSVADSTKDALRKKASPPVEAAPEEVPETTSEPNSDALNLVRLALADCKDVDAVNFEEDGFKEKYPSDVDAIKELAETRRKELNPPATGNKKQKTLA